MAPQQDVYMAPQHVDMNMAMYGGTLPQSEPYVQVQPMSGEVPDPATVAEEHRRNLDQARQNLELKTRQLIDQNEQYKQSLTEQASQQTQEYKNRVEAQVQQSHQEVDIQTKAKIDGLVRTVQEYQSRLERQAAEALGRYQTKMVQEAIDKAQRTYKENEVIARNELDEQMKSIEAFAKEGSIQGSQEWQSRAQARYQQQLQEMQQTMQASIQRASEFVPPAAGSVPPAAEIVPPAASFGKLEAPAQAVDDGALAQAVDEAPAQAVDDGEQLDDTN